MNNESGYIIVEGNIGVGKSTFSRLLAEAFGKLGCRAAYLPEPDEKTNPFLAAYYASPEQNAYKMQMHLLHQRFKATRYAQAASLAGRGWYVLDRSYFGDVCFANVQKSLGYFTEAECESYLDAHRNMREFIEPPTAAIFLHASPEVCNRRICRRARDCEKGIAVEYLQELQNELVNLEHVLASRCPVLSFDWSTELNETELWYKALEIARRLLDIERTDWSF